MATYPQFGHPPTLPPSQLLTSATKPASNGSSPEPVRASAPPGMSATPISVPPGAAQGPYAAAVPYNPALLAYPRLPGLSESMYGAASLAASSQGIYTLGTDPAAFYVNPITGTPYDLKDNAEIWRNLAQPTACLPYDPATLAAYPYAGYGGIDLSLAARRKNATKENTSTLKAWLGEHKKNPYPTKGEKIMLAIITKMTLTQVSTWFANARRRLKKENKMTWSPKSKEDGSDDEGDNDDNPDVRQNEAGSGEDAHNDSLGKDGDHTQVDVLGCDSDDEDNVGDDSSRLRDSSADRLSADVANQREASSPGREGRKDTDDSAGRTSPTQRPRIWSLDDVLGPTRSSSPPRSQHSPSTPAYTTSTLPFPMPLKPTATSLPMGLSHTAASLRHWAERGPYSIPHGLATSMAHHYGLSAGMLSSAGGGPMRPGHATMSFPGIPQAHLPQHGSMGPLGPGGSAVHPAMHAAGAGAASMAGPLGHAPPAGLLTTSQSTSPIRLSPSHQHPLRNGLANGPSPRTPESDRSSPPPSFTAFRPVPRSKPTDVVKV